MVSPVWRLKRRICEGLTYMSSVPARYDVSGERRKPNPSGRTSSVPPPYMLSPFLAWFLSSAKMSSCLRMRLAPSTSFLVAISRSSETWRFFRSDKCINRASLSVGAGGEEGESSPAYGTPVSGCGAGRCSSGRLREKLRGLDMAVNECGELGFGKRADLGRFHGTVLEKHEGGDAADAVLGRRRLVFVYVEFRDLEAA